MEANRDGRAQRRRQVSLLPDAWFRDLTGLLRSSRSVDVTPHLEAIRCPTLVVAAGEDRFIPQQRMERLADGIPDARLEVLEGAGHAVVVERPDALVDLARAHLQAVTA